LNVHDFSPCVGPANAGEMVFSNPQSRRAIGAPIRPGTCLSRGQAVSTGLDRPPVSALAADAGGDVVGRETCSLSALLALRSMAACQTSQSCPRTGSRSSVPRPAPRRGATLGRASYGTVVERGASRVDTTRPRNSTTTHLQNEETHGGVSLPSTQRPLIGH